jgi:hypothetical protein
MNSSIANLEWPYIFFHKSADIDEAVKDKNAVEDTGNFNRIRCPVCCWQPERSSRWMCRDPNGIEHPSGGCRARWNTFDTRGLCPGCNYQWKGTMCLSCRVISPHEDWYEDR